VASQDIYQRLTFKTVAFWEVVSSLYNVDYVIKVDDDSYVRLDRLSLALSQWAQMGAGEGFMAAIQQKKMRSAHMNVASSCGLWSRGICHGSGIPLCVAWVPAEYIGCFKTRDNADNRLRLRTHRWYDPHYKLFEGDSSRYAEGPFYVIHGHIVDGIVRSGLAVRMGGPNEGSTYALLIPTCTLQPPSNNISLCAGAA
jgi:galactosylxylosylprotein 3-beta-galactosyltransferase